MKTCMECGDSFEPSRFTTVQRFCSKRCAHKHSHKRAAERRTATCKVCGKLYHPKEANRTTCCSRECGFEYQRARLAFVSEAKRTAARLRDLYHRVKVCKQCGLAFPSKHGSIFCSEVCRFASSSVSGSRGKCKICGKPAALVNSNLSRYCEECRIQTKKITRKIGRWNRDRRKVEQTPAGRAATHKSARDMVELLRSKLIRADGKCRLCGLAMSKRCDPSSDRAVEFDHMRPLCDGGSDQPHNLQAICRKCNGLKAAFTAPEIVIRQWMNDKDLHSHLTRGH